MVSWGQDEVRPQPVPATVWEHDAGPVGNRAIVGFVYELVLEGQADGEHPYVGKAMGETQAAVTRRIHGPQSSAHTSLQSIARDRWKSRILSGRRGYRILERVRDTGLGRDENDRAVRRAEAFWIDRLRPVYNDVRPVRPVGEVHARPASRPARRSTPRSRRLGALLTLMVIYTGTLAALAVAINLPLAAGAFIALPGPWLAWRTMVRVDRFRRKVRRVLR